MMHFLKTIRFKVWINVFFRFKVLLFQTQGFKAFRDSILDDQENVPYFLHPIGSDHLVASFIPLKFLSSPSKPTCRLRRILSLRFTRNIFRRKRNESFTTKPPLRRTFNNETSFDVNSS
ncbi:hypothetical protein YC2023_076115 [Brassica napus]